MEFEEILFEKENGTAILTLNRPNRLNAFTNRMYQELPNILDEVRKDDKIKVIILTGAGRGFCAGSEMFSVSERVGDTLKMSQPKSRFQSLQQIGAIALDIANIDKPIIAAINGVAVGAGFSLALLTDIRLASQNVRLGARWSNIGLAPDLASTYYLPRIVGISKAMELMITGDLITADEAFRIGLVNMVTSPEHLMIKAREMAEKIVNGPSIAIELTKRGLYRSLNNDLKTQLDYETYAQHICRQTEDAAEGVNAFIEKRKPLFKGM